MRSGVIIQARYASSRLSGKILKNIAGKPVLSHIAERALQIAGLDAVCFAISDDNASDVIADYLIRHYDGVKIIRGAQEDVLARYYQSAKMFELDNVMRITSDCPLIDPFLCGDMLNFFQHENYDYLSNNMIRAFPHGLDCEIMSFTALEQAFHQADKPEEREHVTIWIRQNQFLRHACLVDAEADMLSASQRWTLDYEEDLTMLDALMQKLPKGADAKEAMRFGCAIAIAKANPEITAINHLHAVHQPFAQDDNIDMAAIAYYDWHGYGKISKRDKISARQSSGRLFP